MKNGGGLALPRSPVLARTVLTAFSEGMTATSSRQIDFEGLIVHGHRGQVCTVESDHDGAAFRDVSIGSVDDIDPHMLSDGAHRGHESSVCGTGWTTSLLDMS